MKISKIVIPVILIAALVFGWFGALKSISGTIISYNKYINAAKESIEDGLYEQAVEYYKSSMNYKEDSDTYLLIMDVYELYYEEEHTSAVRSAYISDMEEAAAAYTKKSVFWEKIIELYMDAEKYSYAYETVTQAMNYGVSSSVIEAYYEELIYMVQTDSKLYYGLKTAGNGYITVSDGSSWYVIDNEGSSVTGSYEMIGILNSSGEGLYMNSVDARFLDSEEITRARFDFEFEDAGCYDKDSGYIPVKIDGIWRYVDLEGNFLTGEFNEAGRFYDGRAAVQTDEGWFLIDTSGERCSEIYEDIKLDLSGNYLQSGIILADDGDGYAVYDKNFEKVSDFVCNDIDIYAGDGLIAYEDDGLWGYIDSNGDIVIEPQYSQAKSFSNGMAAVADEDGKWGFINEDYELVIECEYLDAYYFTSDGTCMVSKTENTWQLMSFKFE